MSCFDLKVCMLGDTEVGKSSLAIRFVKNSFNEGSLQHTVCAAFSSKTVKTNKGTNIRINIWDTAGQERFKSLAPLFYRNAAVVLVVYSIVNLESLVRGAKNWIREVRCSCPPDVVIVLVGNKADLDSLREVEVDEAQQFANQIGVTFYESSAKTGLNVEKIFKDICTKFEQKNIQQATVQNLDRERLTKVSNAGIQIQSQKVSTHRCCKS